MSEPSGLLPSVFRRGPRGTVDVIADILYLCRVERNKTAIMYQANLSYQMLKFYIWHMVELRLLEVSEGLNYRTTENGEEFLAHYQKLAEVLARLGRIHGGIIHGDEENTGHILGRQYRRGKS